MKNCTHNCPWKVNSLFYRFKNVHRFYCDDSGVEKSGQNAPDLQKRYCDIKNSIRKFVQKCQEIWIWKSNFSINFKSMKAKRHAKESQRSENNEKIKEEERKLLKQQQKWIIQTLKNRWKFFKILKTKSLLF